MAAKAAEGSASSDPMCGLSIGTKVLGEGTAGREMGIGMVVGPSSVPGLVVVRMEQSGKDMALPGSKLQKLMDEKIVKAAERMVNRVSSRDAERSHTC